MKLIKVFILIIFTSLYVFAQNTIHGTVYDKKENTPLVGVNVLVKELKIGTTTDTDGNFTFKNLPDGKYTLILSLIGHKTKIESIQIPLSKNILVELEDGYINLNEVVITGNPLSLDPKELSQTSLIISNQNLEIKRSSTVAEILNFQPGISMRSNGSATSRPVIRGFSNNRVLILENGLRMGDLSNTSDDHGVSADGGNAEKIEILRGPASLLYGSNAIGGVINVITEAIPTFIPDKLDGTVNLNSSSNNKGYFGDADLHYGISDFAFHGNIFKRKNHNYFDGNNNEVLNSNQSTDGYQLGFSYKPNFGLAGFSLSNFNNEYGLPFNNQEESEEGPVKIKMQKKDYRFLFESNQLGSFLSSMSVKAGYQDYNHKEISVNEGIVGTEFGLKNYSTDISFKHNLLFNQLNGVFGIWLMKQKYTVIGEEAFTPNADYSSFAFYFFEQTKVNDFNLQFGARFENNTIKIPESILSGKSFPSFEKSFNSLSGSIGLVYNFSDIIKFYTNVASAFRSPTIEEMSSYAIHAATGTFDIGERNLSTEKNYGVDFGFRLIKPLHTVEVNFFYNNIKDYIFRKPTELFYNPNDLSNPFNKSQLGLPVFQYSQGDAIIYGSEIKAQHDFFDNLTTIFIFDFVRGLDNRTKENLPQMPPMRFSYEQRYSTDNYWIGFNWKLAAEQNKTSQFEEPTKGYGLLDLYGGVKILTGKFAHVFNLKITNAFNQAYKDHLSSIKSFAFMQGRNVILNYKFLF